MHERNQNKVAQERKDWRQNARPSTQWAFKAGFLCTHIQVEFEEEVAHPLVLHHKAEKGACIKNTRRAAALLQIEIRKQAMLDSSVVDWRRRNFTDSS